jgi:hypothetical protein
MLKVILYIFKKTGEMLSKYQDEQSILIAQTETELEAQRADLVIATKLASKMAL